MNYTVDELWIPELEVRYEVLRPSGKELELLAQDFFPIARLWIQIHCDQVRRPASKLLHPIGNRRFRRDNEVWRLPPNAPRLMQVADDTDRLDGLAQAHLVREQAIHSALYE